MSRKPSQESRSPASETPVYSLPAPQPIPPSIEAIADPVLRQRAIDAWNCASTLRQLIDCWRTWAVELYFTGDADPALGIRLLEESRTCVYALCRHNINSPPFEDNIPKQILPRFPDISPLLYAKHSIDDYQRGGGYPAETLLKVNDLTQLQGKLWMFMLELAKSPSMAFLSQKDCDERELLTDSEQDLLDAALELNCVNMSSRKSQEEIAERAGSKGGTGNTKALFRRLINFRYLQTNGRGRASGTWLTPRGQRIAQAGKK